MNSGGKRAGAGRPKIAEEDRRVVLSCRVAPATLAALQAAARKRRLRIGTLLDALAADLSGAPAGSFVEALAPVPFKAPVEAPAPAPGPLPGPLEMEPVEEPEEVPVEEPRKEAPKEAREEPRKEAPKASPKETSGQGFRVKWTEKAAPIKATKEELTVNGEPITMETIEAFRKDRDESGVPAAFLKASKHLPSGVATRLMELAYKKKI